MNDVSNYRYFCRSNYTLTTLFNSMFVSHLISRGRDGNSFGQTYEYLEYR